VLGLSTGLVGSHEAGAVSLGQVDTFEDATTQGWVVNLLGTGSHPAPPANVPSDGPAGADDNYLLLTSVGGAEVAGNRLTVINATQWAGDYSAAGVTGIAMDLRNLGSTDLFLRLLLEDPTTGPPTNSAVSTDAIFLPAGGAWTHVLFEVTAADLTAVLGSVGAALADATLLRIFHNPTAGFPGPSIVASLGVDNVRAVPEPGVAFLLAIGLGALSQRRRR
jgi:hypothetical protein